MLALQLATNIGTLFVMMLAGFIMVKAGLLGHSASKPLSNLLLYVFFPCAIIVSFEVEFSVEILEGLGIAFAAAAVIQLGQIALVKASAKPLGLDPIDQCSAIYSNCGNLIIPLVISTLGSEWVVYSLGFICVNTALMFTHAKSLISGKSMRDIRSIVLNPSIISITIGLVLFLGGLRLPGPIDAAAGGLADMLGPTAMLIAGINIASAPLRQTFSQKRVWLITFLRLVVLSLISCIALKLVASAFPAGDLPTILLITLLAAAAPCASFVVNFAVIYDRNDVYASAINVVSTVCCIVTMPLMTALYLL
ncbi:MAG: AEC family transporter [Coriobacteriia bacterium]|nr:AEC family transporter [Coriobacteriia bacterium]